MREWWSNFTAGTLSGFVSGILGALAVAVLLALFAESVADRALAANPTCAAPAGLKPIPAKDITADGQAFKDKYGSVYKASAAIDGFGGSIWIPPLLPDEKGHPLPVFDATNDKNVLTLRLAQPTDVELVCIVNGLGNTYSNYENWGRVRTITVWKESSTDVKTTVLQSLGADTFPNAQFAARRLGDVSELHIRLEDAYAGLTMESYDPDVCFGPAAQAAMAKMSLPPGIIGQPRYADGCIEDPAPYAGLADVYLYTKGNRSGLWPLS